MPFDAALAERVRAATRGTRGLVEKKMFGGVGFLLYGNLLVGVWKDYLVVRLGIEAAEQALTEPHVQEFDITGKALRGWAMVAPAGYSGPALEEWIARCRQFVETLPRK